ncbi:MAG: hypothetical protein WCG80_02990 [Spirochaetales bacterium]
MKASDRIIIAFVVGLGGAALLGLFLGLSSWLALPAGAALGLLVNRGLRPGATRPAEAPDLRDYQRLISEFPSGAFRQRLEQLNLLWAQASPGSETDFQLRYAEALTAALQGALAAGNTSSEIERALDELIDVFEQLASDRKAEARERLEAGLAVLRLTGPAGRRD